MEKVVSVILRIELLNTYNLASLRRFFRFMVIFAEKNATNLPSNSKSASAAAFSNHDCFACICKFMQTIYQLDK